MSGDKTTANICTSEDDYSVSTEPKRKLRTEWDLIATGDQGDLQTQERHFQFRAMAFSSRKWKNGCRGVGGYGVISHRNRGPAQGDTEGWCADGWASTASVTAADRHAVHPKLALTLC